MCHSVVRPVVDFVCQAIAMSVQHEIDGFNKANTKAFALHLEISWQFGHFFGYNIHTLILRNADKCKGDLHLDTLLPHNKA